MNHESTKIIVSAVRDGVSFTIKSLGEAPRGRVELQVMDARAEQNDLALEDMELQEELEVIIPPEDVTLPDIGLVPREQIQYLTPEKKVDWVIALAQQRAEALKTLPAVDRAKVRKIETTQVLLREKFRFISQTKIQPAWIRAGLVSIDGIELDGKPLTVEPLIEIGPRSLSEEIFDAIYRESHLSDADAKNLQSPSFSGAVEDGATTDGTVPNANVKNSGNTKDATAVSTSLSQ